MFYLFALLTACGGSSTTESTASQSGSGCGGHPIPCTQVVEQFLRDPREAPLIAMELEELCSEQRPDVCAALGRFLIDGADVPHDPLRAAELLADACHSGDLEACERAGRIVYEREPQSERDSQAVTALRRACDAGGASSCVLLGAFIERGRGADRDRAAALSLYERACEGGELRGCRRVADHYVGTGERARLVQLYTGMCEAGTATGCTMLADLYHRQGDVREHYEAGLLLERGCQGGSVDACIRLARELGRGGLGVLPDPDRARSLLTPLCEDDRAPACAELGVLHEHGLGGDADVTQARAFYERACERRSGIGCYRLGLAYREDRPRPDHERAVALFREACDSGEIGKACGSLAAAYDLGRGVEQSRATALPLYHRACDAGHADSCLRLATLVEEGVEAEADPDTATAHRQRACGLRPRPEECRERQVTFEPLRGSVSASRGRRVPSEGVACSAVVDRVSSDVWCHVRVSCGGVQLYGDGGGWARCEVERRSFRVIDERVSAFDETPALYLDSESGVFQLGDVARGAARSFVVSSEAAADAE